MSKDALRQSRMILNYQKYLTQLFGRPVSELEASVLWNVKNAKAYRSKHSWKTLLTKEEREKHMNGKKTKRIRAAVLEGLNRKNDQYYVDNHEKPIIRDDEGEIVKEDPADNKRAKFFLVGSKMVPARLIHLYKDSELPITPIEPIGTYTSENTKRSFYKRQKKEYVKNENGTRDLFQG